MKTISNRLFAALVVAILAVGPTAAALPRDRADRGIPEKILRLIRKIDQIFRIQTSSSDPVIPRP